MFQLYEDMAVVKKAHSFVVGVYKASKGFPKDELYGLTSQLRRAAVSIPANICEGRGHSNDKELYRYLNIARASLSECSYLLFLAKDLSYISAEDYAHLHSLGLEVGRMTAGLQSFIRSKLVPKGRVKG